MRFWTLRHAREQARELQAELPHYQAEREDAARRLADARRLEPEVRRLADVHRRQRARNHIADDLDTVLNAVRGVRKS